MLKQQGSNSRPPSLLRDQSGAVSTLLHLEQSMMRAAGTRQEMDVSQPQAFLELGQHAGSSAPVPEPLQMLLGYAEEASSDSPAHDLPGELSRVKSVLATKLGTDAATCPTSCKTGALEKQTELSFDMLLTQVGHAVKELLHPLSSCSSMAFLHAGDAGSFGNHHDDSASPEPDLEPLPVKVSASRRLKKAPRHSTATGFHHVPGKSVTYYDKLTVQHPELDAPLDFCLRDRSHCALVSLVITNRRETHVTPIDFFAMARECRFALEL